MPVRDPGEQIGFVLWQVQHRLQVQMEARLATFRLSLPQFGALSLLALHPGQTAADLARRMGLSPQAAHTMVGRLEAARYVERVDTATGGRALPMQITPHGRSALTSAAAEVDTVQEQFFHGLPVEQRTQLLVTLQTSLQGPQRHGG